MEYYKALIALMGIESRVSTRIYNDSNSLIA